MGAAFKVVFPGRTRPGEKRSGSKPGRVTAALFILAVAVGFIGMGFYLQERMARLAGWPQAPAQILESRLEQVQHGSTRPGNRVWQPHILYRYEVQGRSYVGERVGALTLGSDFPSLVESVVRRHPAGSQTRVHYNPADPAEAVLEPTWGRPFAHGLIWAGLALGFIGLLALRRARSPRPEAATRASVTRPPAPKTQPRGPVVTDRGREDRRRILLLGGFVAILVGGYWMYAHVLEPMLTGMGERPAQQAARPVVATPPPSPPRVTARTQPQRAAQSATKAPPSQTAAVGSQPEASVPGAAQWTVITNASAAPAQTVFISRLQVRPWRLAAGERRVPLSKHLSGCTLPAGSYPADSAAPWYGRVVLHGTAHCIAITGWEHGRPLLWFDRAGDGSLADDPPWKNQGSGRLAARVRLPMPDPEVRAAHPTNAYYTLWMWIREVDGRPVAYYYPTVELEGTVALAGTRRKVVVAERHDAMDGDFTDDGVYVDLNGDGRVARDEYLPPGAALRTHTGTLWRLVVAPGADTRQ